MQFILDCSLSLNILFWLIAFPLSFFLLLIINMASFLFSNKWIPSLSSILSLYLLLPFRQGHVAGGVVEKTGSPVTAALSSWYNGFDRVRKWSERRVDPSLRQLQQHDWPKWLETRPTGFDGRWNPVWERGRRNLKTPTGASDETTGLRAIPDGA